MSIEENRNCSCNCNCECEKENTVDCDLRREMIQEIRCCEFAITELALYLDTHPDDQKALCLHRKYCKQFEEVKGQIYQQLLGKKQNDAYEAKVKELKDKYQKVYGPLTINYPCNKWRWLEEPWPWERGNY